MQILVNPGDIRPIKDTTTKTLRALAIHITEEGLAGPYAGIDPNEVRAAADPGDMLPVRVESTVEKEIIPAHTQRGERYPLQQVWEAQRAEGDLNKQLGVRARLPADTTADTTAIGRHTDIRHAITHKCRCTRSQRVGINIGEGNNTTPTRTVRRRVKGKRERRHNRVTESLAERNNGHAYPMNDYIGEHLLAEHIGEHLTYSQKLKTGIAWR